MAYALAQHGSAPNQDMEELWRRIIFTVLVSTAVNQWQKIAVRYGLKKKEIERMASAFEHEDWEKARNAS